ncbi:MAG: glucan-binding protein, partial [Clostridiaceae bacterium]|nr:glucan-binding protein [Clostridiaceae bacterium]
MKSCSHKRKIKSIAALAACCLFVSAGTGVFPSFAHTPDESRFLNGTWEKDDHGWWFANKGNPAYFTSTWAEYQGYSYYFGADGYLVTGWNYFNNHWYRFNPEIGSDEGALMTG